MTLPKKIGYKRVWNVLVKLGFQAEVGHHHILLVRPQKKPGEELLKVVLPRHDQLAKGTLLSIVRQAGLTKEEFLALL